MKAAVNICQVFPLQLAADEAYCKRHSWWSLCAGCIPYLRMYSSNRLDQDSIPLIARLWWQTRGNDAGWVFTQICRLIITLTWDYWMKVRTTFSGFLCKLHHDTVAVFLWKQSLEVHPGWIWWQISIGHSCSLCIPWSRIQNNTPYKCK